MQGGLRDEGVKVPSRGCGTRLRVHTSGLFYVLSCLGKD